MTQTVLVTGGTGFVAGWCIAGLLERGYRVRTTVRSLSREPGVRQAVAAVTDAGDRLSFLAADLSSDEGWDDAAAGCDYVLHIASPLSGAEKKDIEALVGPARDGTLRVLRAAVKAGVKRVVVTSSTAACDPTDPDRSGDETVWTDTNIANTNAYRLSKVIAERAAWDFIAGTDGGTSLTTILPGAIFGPVLAMDNLGSVQFIQRLLHGRPPAIPRIGMQIVDVRDLATLHIAAMTAPEAAGERFVATGELMRMQDIAATLRTRLGARAAKVPTRILPNLLLRGLAVFLPPLRALLPLLGRRPLFSAAKARRMLGFAPRPVTETIIDCAESLLARETG